MNEEVNNENSNEEKVIPTAKEQETAAELQQTQAETEAETPKSIATEHDDDELENATHEEPEVESDDEDHDEFAEEHAETPDYEHMSNKELLLEAKKLLEEPVQQIKSRIELIKTVLYKNLQEIRQEKLQEFVEAGGAEIDFQYLQPERDTFKGYYREFREKRLAYYKNLEATLNQNLLIKQNLIDRLKELVTKEENIGESFKEFREIQDKWREVGPVPRAESQNLWQTYKHHEENFYDFIRISKELRDLDFKKNLEAKVAICEEAEAGSAKPINEETFKLLQNLHKKWKEIGPVDRENREIIWQRFSEATKLVHDMRRQHYEVVQREKEVRLQQKEEIVAQLEALTIAGLKTHNQWQQAAKQREALGDAFRKVGRINLPGNDALWTRFRETNREFNRAKNHYYKEIKKEQYQNLERKKALLDRAKELMDSENWKETTTELKKIQSDWKKIGFAPRTESEAVWQEFKVVCNHFFDRLTERNKAQDQALFTNYEEKQKVFTAVEALDSSNPTPETVSALKAYITKWKEIGPLPREKRSFEQDFNNLLDTKFKDLKVSKEEARLIRFENKVNTLVDNDDKRAITKEIDGLQKRIDEAKRELNTLENNILFFSSSNANSPLLRNAQQKIERVRDEIELLKKQKRMLRDANNNS